jgi:ankyrin repeat protein
VVKLLLEKGAEPDPKDKDGWTPLHDASRKGHEAVVNLLLEKGAEPGPKDKDRQTPIIAWAGRKRHEESRTTTPVFLFVPPPENGFSNRVDVDPLCM